ncbi:MAG: translocated intimin receptor Tir [Acidobacteria bacterium]|nr:MAG: translocated intimin receptor Tir [Acidobacteriota bacterium]
MTTGRARNSLAAMLTDVQFWVPVAALAGGLLLLRWIA